MRQPVIFLQPIYSTQNYNVPNNREWAILIWIGAIFLLVVWKRDVRRNVSEFIRVVLSPKLLVPLVLMLAYIALEAWIGLKASLWTRDLIKDTVVWSTVALALFLRSAEVVKRPHFFRKRAAAAIGLTGLISFVTNLYVLGLVAEVLLQPLSVLLAGLAVVAEWEARHQPVKRLAEGLLSVIGLGLLAFAIQQLVVNWAGIDKHILLLQLSLPVWLTIGLLPFIYLLGLWANYEGTFIRVQSVAHNSRSSWRAKMALITKLHVRARESGAFGGSWLQRITAAPDFKAARRVAADFRNSLRDQERARLEEQERLRRYAGSDEADVDGRRLDRREFSETMRALRSLADSQMGWYYNEDEAGGGHRYRSELLEALGPDFFSDGLPEGSNLSMNVAKDGQAWYAWRRTITGWVFAVGAAGPPPDQWLYDGLEPPHGFPGEDPAWDTNPSSSERARNWSPPER